MKFGYTILYVNNVQETLSFYEKAFGLEIGMMADTQEYGELKTGQTTLAFAAKDFVKTHFAVPFEEAALNKLAPPVELAFVSDNVADDFEKALRGGAVLVKRPEIKSWGQQVAYVRDNNGFLVEICSPLP
ncbi:MAG: VOC family protein [Cyanobacteria bacterium]|nr:VOC family protein [Cyanobacteriota bacterium]